MPKTRKTNRKTQPKNKKTRSRKWSAKYKRSIDCKNPKGFSQKQYCKRKKRGGKYRRFIRNTK